MTVFLVYHFLLPAFKGNFYIEYYIYLSFRFNYSFIIEMCLQKQQSNLFCVTLCKHHTICNLLVSFDTRSCLCLELWLIYLVQYCIYDHSLIYQLSHGQLFRFFLFLFFGQMHHLNSFSRTCIWKWNCWIFLFIFSTLQDNAKTFSHSGYINLLQQSRMRICVVLYLCLHLLMPKFYFHTRGY